MNDLLNGMNDGLKITFSSLPVMISFFVTYGFYNYIEDKGKVLFFGVILILFFSYAARAADSSLIDYCSYAGCFYIETGSPIANLSLTGTLLITLLAGFLLGIFLAYHFPWTETQKEKMFTSKEVSNILQIPEDTVIRWVESKFIFGIKHGNGASIPQHSLIEWLKRFSKLNAMAHEDKSVHWINKTMIKNAHLIRARKEAMS